MTSSFSANTVSDCGNYHIIGGYYILGINSMISKVYSNLIYHRYIRITFYLIKIGIWDNNTLNVILDNQIVKSLIFSIR